VASTDRQFLEEAAKGGQAEVALGKLASERAQNDDVKKFARRMVDDHGKANEELADLARDKGLNLPKTADQEHKALQDRLAKLSGPDFDREYVKEMVKDHQKTVKRFQAQAGQTKDEAVKKWVDKTLPTLREHLKEIQSVAAKVQAKK
jgi:putative membrane protein